ncbi:aminoglycoside phosphotransferase family protein [Legionella spiritensis]|uniref:Aminoglycoside phosphotransferase n=1 Tax=Legionella spiritensis TaxID=452 RepID=A0A0W0YZ45_LEGSP|nr:aminoglycoside phosphotransferase family protein [Legionella spiritensis]KTD62135.1 aminoglycoside phosphotransferase [Legionella spiritensis]SNV34018.1 aminoglycoside phosphotransferase [Legionella spiritensis]
MTNQLVNINSDLVKQLILSQFPQWKDLPVKPVALSGWDNRTYHLGDDMLVRLPSAESYAAQVDKEQAWLPKLASKLPLQIPKPLALGQPEFGYPFNWSVYEWIGGETLAEVAVDKQTLAKELADFLTHLYQIPAMEGPAPGAHNFYRGGSLVVYDVETRQAIQILEKSIDAKTALSIWEIALTARWQNPPVWVHGDISPGNLIVRDEHLHAVIDFGLLSVGDPACDLVMAWNYFGSKGRQVFKEAMALDNNTWRRARGWALWKALIIASGMSKTNAVEAGRSHQIIEDILNEYQHSTHV